MKLSHKDRKGTEKRHLLALRLVRYRSVIRTIPKSASGRAKQLWQNHALMVTGQLGKKRLARVVWPWQSRPVAAKATPVIGISRARRLLLVAMRETGNRVMRGKLSNPTVLR